ncbi:MAG: hypothetical protein GQ574_00925 [Crocinitomix sp.]|nr:hypothetical protein [Crocinitomix sp.]
MKHVILPTDFSNNAWKAMSYAAQLFHNVPCNYILLNTFSVPYSYADVSAMPNVELLTEDSESQLQTVLKRFKELDHHDNSTFKTLAKFASLVDSVRAIETEHPDDCTIVMGTKGAGGLGETFLGTMTSHVVNSAKSPVICVPNEAELSVPKNLMLAVDSEGVDKMEEIQLLVDIANQHQSAIRLVNVPISEEEVLSEDSAEQFVLDNYLGKTPHTYHTLHGNYKEDLLTQFAERNDVDLIALIRRDRGFWKNLFHRSLTKSMSFYSDKPLLILRD